MKRITMLLGAGLLMVCSTLYVLVPSVAEGAVPQLINFQGILKDGSGNPVANGSYSVIFTIYDAPAGGSVQWAETTSVSTNGGLFSVLLGSLNPVPDSAFNNPNRYLGVKVGADPEMTPRQQLVSVGFGYRVNSVDGASGGNLTGNLTVSGNVGIGTNNPLNLLHLKGINYKMLLESSGNVDVVIGRADNTRYGNYILADGDPGNGANNRWAIGLRNGDSKLHLYDEQNSLNVMVLEPGGKVGINTSSPEEGLHIGGSAAQSRILFSNGGDLMWKNTTGANTPVLTLHSDDNVYLDAQATATSDLVFRTNTTFAERMRITDAGNVGIGIASPAAQLHVHDLSGTINGSRLSLSQTATGSTIFDGTALICTSPNKAYLWNYENGPSIFGTNNTERMRIDSTGKVGVGTSTPNSRLHVSGSFATNLTVTPTDLTLTDAHSVVQCTNSSPITINLPPVSGVAGRQYVIKRTGSANVTIDPAGAETIDFIALTYALTVIRQYVVLVSNGSAWLVIGNN